MRPIYIIEKWPLGWIICSAPGVPGIPMDALSECSKLFPKNSVMDMGIIHHLKMSGKTDAMICIVTQKNSEQWRKEIEKSLIDLPPQERWWRGVDVGASSAAMFAVLCDSKRLAEYAMKYGGRSTPKDADDFGRCARLLSRFPEWKDRLHEVAEAYPETKWPEIIMSWDAIAADPALLNNIHSSGKEQQP